MIPPQYVYDKYKDKAIFYYTANTTGDARQLMDFGVNEILVSYFYLKKSLKNFDKVVKEIKERDGVFMIDSGAYSFMMSANKDPETAKKVREPEFWMPYLLEYVDWIRNHKEYIYACANLDLDNLVGREVVKEWNKKYFEPLIAEGVDVCFVCHEDKKAGDPYAYRQFEEYARKYHYVGVNQMRKKQAALYYTLALKHKARIHGFAWTDNACITQFPFFSVDSISWRSGSLWGMTPDYDGHNFHVLSAADKDLRKRRKNDYESVGIKWEDIKNEKRKPINDMGIFAMLGLRRDYMHIANIKLNTREVAYYEHRR